MSEDNFDISQSLFLSELVKQWRALDNYGQWEKKSDAALLAPYIVTKEQRKLLPMIADPTPETLNRIELFHSALCMAIEKACGVMVQPMMKMHHEGFGRVVLIAGRLVVLSRTLRDVHRFGFESLEKLAAEGEKHLKAALEMVEKFPDVAKL